MWLFLLAVDLFVPHTCPAKPSQVKSSQVKSSQVLLSFTFVPPAVPNGAGDHRAARTPPWRGAIRLAVRWSPPSPYFPTSGPPTCGSCARLSSSLSGAVDGDLFVPTMWAKPSPSLLIDVNGGSPAESRGLRSLRRAAPLWGKRGGVDEGHEAPGERVECGLMAGRTTSFSWTTTWAALGRPNSSIQIVGLLEKEVVVA